MVCCNDRSTSLYVKNIKINRYKYMYECVCMCIRVWVRIYIYINKKIYK